MDISARMTLFIKLGVFLFIHITVTSSSQHTTWKHSDEIQAIDEEVESLLVAALRENIDDTDDESLAKRNDMNEAVEDDDDSIWDDLRRLKMLLKTDEKRSGLRKRWLWWGNGGSNKAAASISKCTACGQNKVTRTAPKVKFHRIVP